MKKYIITSILGLSAIVGLLSFSGKVNANPPSFMTSQTINTFSLTATTSYSYTSPGVGTTTYSMDTFQSGYNPYGADNALLFMQFTATSTPGAHQLNFAIQYSQDNVDWYSIAQPISTNATSTVITQSYSDYSWVSATSTGTSVLNPSATTTVYFQSITVPTYTRYVRVVFYTLAGNGQNAVWAEWVAKKQKQ